MATYNGRRAPNVSQYINSLNTIPSAADMATQQDFSNFEDDLSLFTNTQFFDFDMADNVSAIPSGITFDAQSQGPNIAAVPFNDFAFDPSAPASLNQHVSPHHSLPNSPPNGLPFANNGQQSQPTVPTAAHFAQHQFQTQQIQQTPQIGDKRNSTTAALPATQDLEEVSRAAAEEDKRRRNTAASARFRVKKKQREQTLEKTAKEMSDKVSILEARVGQLEMENKWLKGLITDKNVRIPSFDKPAVTIAPKKTVAVVSEEDEEDEDDDFTTKTASTGSKNEIISKKSEPEALEVADRSLDEKKRGVGTETEAIEA